MINKKRIIAVIPARGGSKGVFRKNLRDLGGLPLVGWTIKAAIKSRYIDRVILSTDDQEIATISKKFGCQVPFIRDPSLATDEALAIDVVIDAVTRCDGYDYVVLLQPTSPLRTEKDIDAAIDLCLDSKVSSCVSVTEVQHSPCWMFEIDSNNRMSPLFPDSFSKRRQDLSTFYSLNGAIYVSKIDSLLKNRSFINADTLPYVMSPNCSIDIDTELDFHVLNVLLKEKCYANN